jgi:hypothetical protein
LQPVLICASRARQCVADLHCSPLKQTLTSGAGSCCPHGCVCSTPPSGKLHVKVFAAVHALLAAGHCIACSCLQPVGNTVCLLAIQQTCKPLLVVRLGLPGTSPIASRKMFFIVSFAGFLENRDSSQSAGAVLK